MFSGALLVGIPSLWCRSVFFAPQTSQGEEIGNIALALARPALNELDLIGFVFRSRILIPRD